MATQRAVGPLSDVSVVIPTLDSASWIGDTVAGWASALTGAEIVVVDDASTDGTAAALAGLDIPHLRVVTNPRRLGQDRATLLGCGAAACRWVITVDDDIVADTLLATTVADAVRHGGITYVRTPREGWFRPAVSVASRRVAETLGVTHAVTTATSTRVFPAGLVSVDDPRPLDHQLVHLEPRRFVATGVTHVAPSRSRYSIPMLARVWFSHVRHRSPR